MTKILSNQMVKNPTTLPCVSVTLDMGLDWRINSLDIH
jgi:hypothetical protein